jgi:hypothetical protein
MSEVHSVAVPLGEVPSKVLLVVLRQHLNKTLDDAFDSLELCGATLHVLQGLLTSSVYH